MKQRCPRCNYPSNLDACYCSSCGRPLSGTRLQSSKPKDRKLSKPPSKTKRNAARPARPPLGPHHRDNDPIAS